MKSVSHFHEISNSKKRIAVPLATDDSCSGASLLDVQHEWQQGDSTPSLSFYATPEIYCQLCYRIKKEHGMIFKKARLVHVKAFVLIISAEKN